MKEFPVVCSQRKNCEVDRENKKIEEKMFGRKVSLVRSRYLQKRMLTSAEGRFSGRAGAKTLCVLHLAPAQTGDASSSTQLVCTWKGDMFRDGPRTQGIAKSDPPYRLTKGDCTPSDVCPDGRGKNQEGNFILWSVPAARRPVPAPSGFSAKSIAYPIYQTQEDQLLRYFLQLNRRAWVNEKMRMAKQNNHGWALKSHNFV